MQGYFESSPKFIELTKSYNYEPVNNIFINTDKIVFIERRNKYETYIRVQDSPDGIWVVEKPEDIIKIM